MTVTDWRKSSRSTSTNCIEVGSWRTSSYSMNGGNCVEAGNGAAGVGVRDTADRGGPVLTFAADEWERFTSALKRDTAPEPAR